MTKYIEPEKKIVNDETNYNLGRFKGPQDMHDLWTKASEGFVVVDRERLESLNKLIAPRLKDLGKDFNGNIALDLQRYIIAYLTGESE